jgi:hypothetical protein
VVLGFFRHDRLIVAGIGLLTHRPYGRTLSIGYGIYAVVTNVLGTIINVVYVLPRPAGKSQCRRWRSRSGGSIRRNHRRPLRHLAWGLIYPVRAAIFHVPPNMVAAFKK